MSALPSPPSVAVDRATRAYHDFLRSLKQYWARDIYGSLHEQFERQNKRSAIPNADAAELALSGSTVYQYYGWLERNLQRLKYASPRGILATVERQRNLLDAQFDAIAEEGVRRGRLRFAPGFELPHYYSEIEFHQHPGGVWSDSLAGVAYDFGRATTLPQHLDPDEIHRRFAACLPGEPFARTLDLGCGTGRSTLPVATAHRNAIHHGIDLSAPCLRSAYARSTQAGLDVYWSQQNAEHTDFPAAHFSLVHSTFLLHEVPKAALRAIATEAFRLLAPGGWFASLDFHSPPGGVWGDFVHYGHARRNEEVFMRSFCETDFLAMQRDIGFREVSMTCFDDGTGLFDRGTAPPHWRFPAQLFLARK